MKALIYESFGEAIRVEELADPSPTKGGVVLKVTATGLCRSDWHAWMGHDADVRLPHVPGHELAGVIVAVGRDVKKFRAGDRVTVPFVGACGTCPECQSGNQQVCDYQFQPGFTHWGSFAEYVAIHYADDNLVKLPEEVDDSTAAILGCRFITSFRAVVDQGKVSAGQFVAVHACGGVGLSAIMIANALGANVIAIDINDDTLAFAKQLGAVHTINAKEEDVVGSVKSFTKRGAHVSIDALGSQATCFNSIANLRKRGKHIQVGLMTGNHQHPKIPMDKVLANELEIIGSHGMQAHRYPEMLEMIKLGKLQPQQLIKKTINLAEAADALTHMNSFSNRGVVVIDPWNNQAG